MAPSQRADSGLLRGCRRDGAGPRMQRARVSRGQISDAPGAGRGSRTISEPESVPLRRPHPKQHSVGFDPNLRASRESQYDCHRQSVLNLPIIVGLDRSPATRRSVASLRTAVAPASTNSSVEQYLGCRDRSGRSRGFTGEFEGILPPECDGADDVVVCRAFVSTFLPRAFRRPVTDTERDERGFELYEFGCRLWREKPRTAIRMDRGRVEYRRTLSIAPKAVAENAIRGDRRKSRSDLHQTTNWQHGCHTGSGSRMPDDRALRSSVTTERLIRSVDVLRCSNRPYDPLVR